MYEIILYDTEDGRCPVQELLDSLETKLLAKTLRTIDLLEMNGPLLCEPYSKPLENGIFELRTKQGSDITRVLYFFIVGKKAVLTNGFIKKSQKTPKAEKELGGGTGQIKLRYVYDMFVARFTWLARVISFEAFSMMVDEALERMKKMLESNKAMQTLVSGEAGETVEKDM